MINSRKHLAEIWHGGDGTRIACTCKQWRGNPDEGLRSQRIAHRAHRVEMGETVKPLKPTQAERLAAAEAAIARVRELHRPAECVNVRCPETHWCIGCDPHGDDLCSEHPWPCPTLAAIDGPTQEQTT